MQPIQNEHIARSLARNLLNIIGSDNDPRFRHTLIHRVTLANSAYRLLYDPKESSQSECELHVPVENVETLKNALVKWATPERLDGDNCYRHDRLGYVHADKDVRLGDLPDTLLIIFSRTYYNFELNRRDTHTDDVSVPLTLNCAELTEVLNEPSTVQYNLMAFVVGRLRRRTPDDEYIFWHAYIRVPGSDQWHPVEHNPISETVQYPSLSSLPTATILDLLTGESPAGEFCMKAWYQRSDATVQATVPSVAAWEESWREELEYSVGMEQGGGMPGAGVAVGIPVAVMVE